jgi:hypothetical protein
MALPTVEYLRECFEYDESTGVLVWKVRPVHHFNGEHGWRTTNGRSAGRVAGSVSGKGYLCVEIEGVSYKAHRIVVALETDAWPDGETDHINGDPSDNRIDNLRVVTVVGNMSNKGIYTRNVSDEPNISQRPQTYLKNDGMFRWLSVI